MSENNDPKPYLHRIKDWKIRNMVNRYLEAREQFVACRRMLRNDLFISFEKMREICDILYTIKEDHHLLFKRLIDPQKHKFEKAHKFMPDKVETEFMNNIGLLFHKVMVTRELKYVMEHYVEQSDVFQKNMDNLQFHLRKIDELFDEGIDILKCLTGRYKDNILLLTLLLEDPARTKKHFGQNAVELLEQFVDGRGLDEVYYSVGKFYARNGWNEKAKNTLEEALKRNPQHKKAQKQLAEIS
ncbi:tetratricopeptide repeat protein [candidate division KSB1 bacterium]|nr:tetratricopeptide repeat protein [candidate division KSB1 bacterium]NIR71189.1 tetratricopeptide repeat protein [candidate division KSB1 bacterium]NIS26174.1 tetratricopeptide repeat protein [candidate division KSB1 bacterium]NIT72939.1 tetratricopeptide repeat protein [candidate division KSB1 bacterium]NIU26821.1 tetratricopeptide repeat protein [candidate division KSB1 bacterium]